MERARLMWGIVIFIIGGGTNFSLWVQSLPASQPHSHLPPPRRFSSPATSDTSLLFFLFLVGAMHLLIFFQGAKKIQHPLFHHWWLLYLNFKFLYATQKAEFNFLIISSILKRIIGFLAKLRWPFFILTPDSEERNFKSDDYNLKMTFFMALKT